MLEEALNKDVTSKELYNNLGIAYYATKDNIAAKQMFKHALEIDNSYKPATDNIKNMENAE